MNCCYKCKWMQTLWKIVLHKLQKLNTRIPYDSTVPLEGIYITKMSVCVSQNIIAKNIQKSLIYYSPNYK